MGSVNPIPAFGEEAFSVECERAGVDGLIVPDLPPEEAEHLENAGRQRGVALIYLLAPNSAPHRIQPVTRRSQGFIYLVSVTGVTGPRDRVPPDLGDFVARVRAATRKPLAVGFGVSSPAQAVQVAALADGVIVGSVFVRLADGVDAVEKARAFVGALRDAIAGQPRPGKV